MFRHTSIHLSILLLVVVQLSAAQGTVGRHDGISRGYKGTQIFNTTFGVIDPDEPNPWSVPWVASYWFGATFAERAYYTIDTAGSSADTMLAVWRVHTGGPITTYADLTLVTKNDNIAGTAQSEVTFDAQPNTEYYVVLYLKQLTSTTKINSTAWDITMTRGTSSNTVSFVNQIPGWYYVYAYNSFLYTGSATSVMVPNYAGMPYTVYGQTPNGFHFNRTF